MDRDFTADIRYSPVILSVLESSKRTPQDVAHIAIEILAGTFIDGLMLVTIEYKSGEPDIVTVDHL